MNKKARNTELEEAFSELDRVLEKEYTEVVVATRKAIEKVKKGELVEAVGQFPDEDMV